MSVVYQLSRCLAFRRIQHPELKWFTLYIPLGAVVFVTGVFFILPVEPRLVGQGSLTRHLIAALAAVATFDRPSLDETMPDPAPTLELRTRGMDEPVALTLRMFLTHLFAYLTALAFFTALFCIAADLVAPSVVAVIPTIPYTKTEIVTPILKGVYVASLAWLISNIVFTGLFGLYFLAERMHRPHA